MNIFVYILILITISNFVMVILGSNVENFALAGLASLGVPAGPDAPRIDMTSAEGSGGVKQAPPMVEPVKTGLASLGGVPAGPDAPRIDMTSAEGSGGVKQAPPMVEVPVVADTPVKQSPPPPIKNETRQEIVLNLCRNSRDFLENNLEFCKTV